ncbi:hypothetical protein QOT17_019416 [Balamuthia mandrillaris]
MKVLLYAAVIVALLGLASAGRYHWCDDDDGGDVNGRCALRCSSDNDCVPAPVCHPHTCLNRNSVTACSPPEVCTEIFDCQAAYTPEDCLCQDGVCVNRNLGRTEC